jgi:hypothetical protein
MPNPLSSTAAQQQNREATIPLLYVATMGIAQYLLMPDKHEGRPDYHHTVMSSALILLSNSLSLVAASSVRSCAAMVSRNNTGVVCGVEAGMHILSGTSVFTTVGQGLFSAAVSAFFHKNVVERDDNSVLPIVKYSILRKNT